MNPDQSSSAEGGSARPLADALRVPVATFFTPLDPED